MLIPKTLGLWSQALSHERGLNIVRPESDDQLVNLNSFLPRITSANTFQVGMMRLEYLCQSFCTGRGSAYEPRFLSFASRNPPLCSIIYSGRNAWPHSRRRRQNPLIYASGNKHAKLAVAAMTEAELGWNRCQMLCGRNRVKRKGSGTEEIQTKQASVRGMKPDHHEAFSDSLDVKVRTRFMPFSLLLGSSHLNATFEKPWAGGTWNGRRRNKVEKAIFIVLSTEKG